MDDHNDASKHARALSAIGAHKGGTARATRLTPEERQVIARQAAEKRWKRDSKKIGIRDNAIGCLLGTVKAIRLICQSEKFRSWLLSTHKTSDDDIVFQGYKFAVKTLLRVLHGVLANDTALKLEEDSLLMRARFHGAPLAQLPNSCEKTILLKNIQTEVDTLLQTERWEAFENQFPHFAESALRPLESLLSVASVRPGLTDMSMDKALLYAAQFQVYLFLNDTRRGLPQGYPEPMLEDKVFQGPVKRDKHYLERVYPGYKFAVQFLWQEFLGSRFADMSLVQLHRAQNWQEFDEYFRPVQSELIEPIETQIGKSLDNFDSLIILKGSARKVLSELLVSHVQEPKLNKKQELQRKFLWYEIELVDASSTIFNGVLTFVSLLVGAVEMRRNLSNPDKVLVARLIHPAGEPDKHDYSYGILLEAYGSMGLTDYSGWLLFYDCCGDYSGFAGSEHTRAEAFIKRYEELGKIVVIKDTIDKKMFLQLMKENLLSATKEVIFRSVETRDRLREACSSLGPARGLLLEAVAYYIFSHSLNVVNARTEWAWEVGGREIDVVIQHNDDLTIVECEKPSLQNENVLAIFQELHHKASLFLQDKNSIAQWKLTKHTKVKLVYAPWARPSKEALEYLRQKGIKIAILSEVLQKLPHSIRHRLLAAMGHSTLRDRCQGAIGGSISLA